MARRMLPVALVERIAVSFESVLPAGVFLRLKGRQLDVESVNGGGWSGETLGVLPWPPMPEQLKLRLAVQSVYETVARGIGATTRPPGREAHRSGEDPFRLRWPVNHAAVRVTLVQDSIGATFLAPNGEAVLTMPTVTWAESLTVSSAGQPRRAAVAFRYVGAVPVDVQARDAERAMVDAARSVSIEHIVDQVRDSNPGTDKEAIRRAFRDAFAAHPDATAPDPGSRYEQRLVDAYAATQGRFAAARSMIQQGKLTWDYLRLLAGKD